MAGDHGGLGDPLTLQASDLDGEGGAQRSYEQFDTQGESPASADDVPIEPGSQTLRIVRRSLILRGRNHGTWGGEKRSNISGRRDDPGGVIPSPGTTAQPSAEANTSTHRDRNRDIKRSLTRLLIANEPDDPVPCPAVIADSRILKIEGLTAQHDLLLRAEIDGRRPRRCKNHLNQGDIYARYCSKLHARTPVLERRS